MSESAHKPASRTDAVRPGASANAAQSILRKTIGGDVAWAADRIHRYLDLHPEPSPAVHRKIHRSITPGPAGPPGAPPVVTNFNHATGMNPNLVNPGGIGAQSGEHQHDPSSQQSLQGRTPVGGPEGTVAGVGQNALPGQGRVAQAAGMSFGNGGRAVQVPEGTQATMEGMGPEDAMATGGAFSCAAVVIQASNQLGEHENARGPTISMGHPSSAVDAAPQIQGIANMVLPLARRGFTHFQIIVQVSTESDVTQTAQQQAGPNVDPRPVLIQNIQRAIVAALGSLGGNITPQVVANQTSIDVEIRGDGQLGRGLYIQGGRVTSIGGGVPPVTRGFPPLPARP